MIDPNYKRQAAKAADALRAALIAVEACGADIELTRLVGKVDECRTTLCRLFDLPPEQAFSEAWFASKGNALGGRT